MLRVDGEALQLMQPPPWDIYSASGALLWSQEQPLSTPEHVAILQVEGWRHIQRDDPEAANALSRAEALRQDRSAETTLASRGRPPLREVVALIADDMSIFRKMLQQILRDQGVSEVHAADTSLSALGLFFQHQPHMVFLDIDMPDLSGLVALKQIKRWAPDTFVCIVTSNGTLVNVKESKQAGVDGFLVKPISTINLTRVMARFHSS